MHTQDALRCEVGILKLAVRNPIPTLLFAGALIAVGSHLNIFDIDIPLPKTEDNAGNGADDAHATETASETYRGGPCPDTESGVHPWVVTPNDDGTKHVYCPACKAEYTWHPLQ